MATMKRRVIYTSDEEWEAYRLEATASGRTVSGFIRSHLGGYLRAGQEADREHAAFVEGVKETAQASAAKMPVPAGTEARYDTRPIRPVPKTRK